MNGKDLLDAFQNIDEDLVKGARDYYREEPDTVRGCEAGSATGSAFDRTESDTKLCFVEKRELFGTRRRNSYRNLFTFATVIAAMICVVLLLSSLVINEGNTENVTPFSNIDTDDQNEDLKDKAEQPRATDELERQIKENVKRLISTAEVNDSNKDLLNLEYLLQHAYETDVENVKYIDVPVGEPFEYKGMEFTITKSAILSGSRFFNKYCDGEDMNKHNADPGYYGGIEKNASYAIIHWSIKKLTDDPVITTQEMILTDGKRAGLFDHAATDMIRTSFKTEEIIIKNMKVGEELADEAFALSFYGASSSKDYYILLPVLNFDDIYGSKNETGNGAEQRKNEFYRIKIS